MASLDCHGNYMINIELEDKLPMKSVKQSSRKMWADNIVSVMAKHHGEDEALLEELLDDSDLEDMEW